MGRPPSSGGPAFRFNNSEVLEMETILQEHNNNMPAREVLVAIADKFSNSPERQGKFVVQMKQIWNWFQNKRYAIRARGGKSPTKLTVSSMQSLPTMQPVHSVTVASTVPAIQAKPASGPTVPVVSGENTMSSSRVPQSVAASQGKLSVASDNTPMEFEARSSRDGAWYDVAEFLSLKNLEAGEPEVLVRFSGFGPEEDEWINVRKHVRHRSLPCESSECVAVLPGDLILCFQEGKEQALYFDAHVLDAQRRRHDVRGCRCRFLVRYDHDQSEEIVPLRKICRRPETDYRLQQLHALDDNASTEPRKFVSYTHQPPASSAEQTKSSVDGNTPSLPVQSTPAHPSAVVEQQKAATDNSTGKSTGVTYAAPGGSQKPHSEVINLDPGTEVENGSSKLKDDMDVDEPADKPCPTGEKIDVTPGSEIGPMALQNAGKMVGNDDSLAAGTEPVPDDEQKANPEPMIVDTSNSNDEGNTHPEPMIVETSNTNDEGNNSIDVPDTDPTSNVKAALTAEDELPESSIPPGAGNSEVEPGSAAMTSSTVVMSETNIPEANSPDDAGKTDADPSDVKPTSK